MRSGSSSSNSSPSLTSTKRTSGAESARSVYPGARDSMIRLDSRAVPGAQTDEYFSLFSLPRSTLSLSGSPLLRKEVSPLWDHG